MFGSQESVITNCHEINEVLINFLMIRHLDEVKLRCVMNILERFSCIVKCLYQNNKYLNIN